MTSARAVGDVLGDTVTISPAGCRFPDAAFDPASDLYLVAWTDYASFSTPRICGRRLDVDAAPVGDSFCISDGTGPSQLFPAVALDTTRGEFLVTWDDERSTNLIYGQRVRASDGALVGTNFAISTSPGIRSAVAYGATQDEYLVTYWIPPGIVRARRVAGGGAAVGGEAVLSSDVALFSGYPAVAYGAARNQFLVTWDYDDGSIRGRILDAVTAAPVAPSFAVTAADGNDRSAIAYDLAADRYLVQYNDHNPGFSYDQSAQLVGGDGGLIGSPQPTAHATDFEGDTQFGGDVAFAPLTRTYFSTFALDPGMAGQESDANGVPIGARIDLHPPGGFSLNNAADPERSRFLSVWELGDPTFAVRVRLFATDAPAIGPDAGTVVAPDAGPVEVPDAGPADGGSGPGPEEDGGEPAGDAGVDADAGDSLEGGCGCRAARGGGAGPVAALWLLTAAALWSLRRRRCAA